MSDEVMVRGEAAVLTTISDSGFPHHCFLSEDEWAESERGLVVSLQAGSRTSRNLLGRPRAAMLRVVAGEPVLYSLEADTSAGPMGADPRRVSIPFRIIEKTVARTPPEEKACLVGGFSFERFESVEESGRRRRVKEELCH